MSKPIVLIAEELSPATLAVLGDGFDIQHCDGANRAELLPALATANAVLVRSATKMDTEAIAAAPNLKIIARAGVGLDNVDIPAATAANVLVVNAPTSNIVSAAELAVALLLSAARNIVPANLALKDEKWKRSQFGGVELQGKTVGIIGMGKIGMLVAKRLAGFDMKFVAFDPYVTVAPAGGPKIEMVTLDELLKQSDFVTIHIPKTAETTGLLDAAALAKMKTTAFVINAARGGVLDETALYEALIAGKLAGAGLDVYEFEPTPPSALLEFDNAILTPHVGGISPQAIHASVVRFIENSEAYLAGKPLLTQVN